MSLGPFCSALEIDEQVLSGEKSVTCDAKNITNGVIWELRKHKMTKKSSAKDFVDWLIKICAFTCENNEALQDDVNEKIEKLLNLRATLLKAPKKYPDEIDRLMKWQFDFPQSMGVEPSPVFEPVVRASLGPKLLKVLKEKAADDDDSMDMSGPSDDDDEQAKRRKAREEIVQLKKDIGTARKAITGLNDRLGDLNKRCALLNDVSKTSVSERRKIESDITKLKTEWDQEIVFWHDCLERLNHVNSNKGNYMDAGYMVRRNKTKQGIIDEVNLEFEKVVEEFKHKVKSILDKESRKKKTVAREYRQKSKSDRKRVRQESEDAPEDAKKICLTEDTKEETVPSSLPVEEFMKSEKIEEFKGGKFSNSLKAIYSELLAMPLTCKSLHEVVFSVLNTLGKLNVDKIPTQSFAGNIFMEARMCTLLQACTDLLKISMASICNNSETKFNLVGTSYEVMLSNNTRMLLSIRDLSEGSPDTSLRSLKDVFGQLTTIKFDGNELWDNIVQTVKSSVIGQQWLEKKPIEMLFLYKQQIVPDLKVCIDALSPDLNLKALSLNNFCTGLYFLSGLSQLVDVTVLAWEMMSQSAAPTEDSEPFDACQILSKTIQRIYSFCQAVDPDEEEDAFSKEIRAFLKKEKKLNSTPFAPCHGNLFNTIFHNSAGLWFFHEVGIISGFLEKVKEKDIKVNKYFDSNYEKEFMPLVRALGLIGKLVVVPLWTVLEDYETEIGTRYSSFLSCVEKWSKDASLFIKGQERVFDDVPVSYDAVYISLVKDSEATDGDTKELVELILTSFIPFIKACMYSDTASSGSNAVNGGMSPDTDSKSMIHKDFGTFDRISKNLHSSATFAVDALIAYSKMKNKEWQDGSKTKQQIFEIVVKNSAKQLKSLYKRKIKLSEIKAQEQTEEFSKCQVIEKRYKLIDDLIKWGGLWKSEKEVDERLKDMKESDRMYALKAQIRFRRNVIGETHEEDGLLDLAYDGECFNSTKLYENLKTILRKECLQTETDVFELASATDNENLKSKIYESCKSAVEIEAATEPRKTFGLKENFHWLLGKLVSHTIVKDGNREILSGVCIARKKVSGIYSYFFRYRYKDAIYKFSESRIAEDYKCQNLRLVEPSTKDIVGAHLSRAFFKDDGDLEWYDCRVIGMASSGPEFVVEFDFYGNDVQMTEDDESQLPEVEGLTFTSHLIEDYRTDRLRFL